MRKDVPEQACIFTFARHFIPTPTLIPTPGAPDGPDSDGNAPRAGGCDGAAAHPQLPGVGMCGAQEVWASVTSWHS